MRIWMGFSVVVAMAVGATGCKPKAGGSCSGSKGACKDGETAILCVDSKWTEVPCRGVTGCMQPGIPIGTADVTCASEKAKLGDACAEPDANACAEDNKQWLKCKGGKWTLEMACGGPRGCVINVKEVRCDGAESTAGSPCKKDGFFSCSPDKAQLLECKGGTMVVASTCKGQNHCQIMGEKLKCDTSLADVGDPCDQEGKPSCSTDKKDIVMCKGGKVTKHQSCPKGCSPAFDEIKCK